MCVPGSFKEHCANEASAAAIPSTTGAWRRASVTMEVYAVTREFTEWGKGIYNRLPSAVRNSLRSSGICHFLVVIRDPDTKTITSFDFGPIGGDVAGLPGLRSALSSELDLSNLTNARDTMDMSSVARELPSLRRSKSDSELLDTAARSTAQESSEAAGGERAASCAGSSDDEASPCAADASRRFESPAPPASASASASPKGRFHRVASTSVIASQTAPRSRWSRLQRARKAVEGEIREVRMDALPKGAHYVGNTALSLEHIRNFNAERCVQYLLHDNDCRHYVNDLCAHLCPNAPEAFPRGVASKVSWQSAWQRVRGGRPHEALVVLPLQVFADVNNAPAVQRMKHAASASFAFGLGMRVVPYLAPTLGLRSGVAAALGTFTRAAPTRRLVTTAAGAFAGVSAETPVVREAIVLGGAAVGGAIDVTRGVAGAGANLLAFAANGVGLGGSGPAAATGAAAGTSMRAASAAATAAGEFAANAKAGEFVSNAGASLAAGAAVGAAAATLRAANDGALARRSTSGEAGDALDRVVAVDEGTGRDARGRVRNAVGRVRRVGRAAVDGIKRFASPSRLSARGSRRNREDVSDDGRAVSESPKRKASQSLPRALRFRDADGESAKARRFDVRRRVFGKVPSAENLASAGGAASSTR